LSGDWKGSSSDDRVPPNDINAEAAVLSAVLIDPTVLDIALVVLEPGQFYSDANRKIFEAFLDLSANGRPIDILTVRSWLADRDLLERAGGSTYLAQILDSVPAVSNIEEYARIVRSKWRARQMISTCQRVSAEGYGAFDVQDYLDRAESDVCSISEERETRQPEPIGDVIRDRFKSLQARLEAGTENMIRTGLDDLDQVVVGFSGPDLVCIAARPGMGKTAFAINNVVVDTAERGIGVGVFSLEMSREQLTDRAICSAALVDSRKIPRGTLSREEWGKITEQASRISKLPIIVDDEGAIQLSVLRSKARRMASDLRKRGNPLGVIVVDYLQLMGTSSGKESRDEKVGANSRGLKALAKELGVVVIMLAQLNRDVERRGKSAKPQLSDLRESGSIEADCDVIMFIHGPKEQDGTSDILVGKHRQFGTGVCTVAWRPQFTRFDNLEPGQKQDEEEGW